MAKFIIMVALMAQSLAASPAGDLGSILSSNQPAWGVRDGLVWTLPPDVHPRGLIRVFYPVLPEGQYDLINFIAIEPIVQGHRGYSELEPSNLDHVPGKRIWTETPTGRLLTTSLGQPNSATAGEKKMEVTLQVEKFDNGAHVRLVLRQSLERPDEIALSVFTEADSAPVDCCILTATMGNRARTRQLWLKHETVSSLELYPNYQDSNFAPSQSFPLSRLRRTSQGDVLVAVTTDEQNPAAAYPFPGSRAWYYGGAKVTQYWRAPAESAEDDLRAVVNGRYTYWRSQQPLPGGIAFENFELNERFREGQTFIFGITRLTPHELGF